MGLTFAQLKKGQAETEVTYDGDKLKVQYNPGKITPSLGFEMNAADSPWVLMLNRCVLSWDLMDQAVNPETGEPAGEPYMYPLDETALSQLPTPFLKTVAEAIRRHVVENSKNS